MRSPTVRTAPLDTSHGAHNITVQLLTACPNRSYLEAHGFCLESYMIHSFEIVDGYAIAADRRVHGVEFDWAGLGAIRV